jgi:tripartite-type tricarboxylate transporter receptor subunit TctC
MWFRLMAARAAVFAIATLTVAQAQSAAVDASQAYPVKPVRMIVPFVPGGPSDILGRALGQSVAERLGQQVVIDNRGGGGGNIGAEIVARAVPDGYTLLLGTPGILIANPAMGKVPFDTFRDFAPVMQVANMTSIMVVHPSLPVRTLREFIDYARARPGQLTYGTSGNGSASHLGTELFKQAARVDITHVPYKGAAPAVTDLLGGHLTVMLIGVPVSLPHVRAGKLNALGIASLQRYPTAMDLPTLAESGLPGFEVANWFAMLAPAGTAAPRVDRLNAEFSTALRSADIRERLLRQGFESVTGTPAQFAAYLRAETEKWTRVVKEARIRPG